jgi:hypothetical protein
LRGQKHGAIHHVFTIKAPQFAIRKHGGKSQKLVEKRGCPAQNNFFLQTP